MTPRGQLLPPKSLNLSSDANRRLWGRLHGHGWYTLRGGAWRIGPCSPFESRALTAPTSKQLLYGAPAGPQSWWCRKVCSCNMEMLHITVFTARRSLPVCLIRTQEATWSAKVRERYSNTRVLSRTLCSWATLKHSWQVLPSQLFPPPPPHSHQEWQENKLQTGFLTSAQYFPAPC